MLDKLDIRVPCDTPFERGFNKTYVELVADPKLSPFHPTRHYAQVANLKPFGYDAVLHLQCRHGKFGHHKLELIEVGQKTFPRMVHEIERIFTDVDTMKLEVMRVDPAADVQGLSVRWFKERIRAQYKQFVEAIGSGDFRELGKGEIQTLTFGRRPNFYRIYDKIAEFRHHYNRMYRDLSDKSGIPSFTEMFGVPEQGCTLTRVERQIGGDRIPDVLATVGQLRNAADFRPFDALGFITGGIKEPNPEDYPFEHYATGMFLRHMAQEQGMQVTRRFISQHAHRNTRRTLRKYQDFLPAEDDNEVVNTEYLNELYRQSALKQLEAL